MLTLAFSSDEYVLQSTLISCGKFFGVGVVCEFVSVTVTYDAGEAALATCEPTDTRAKKPTDMRSATVSATRSFTGTPAIS